MTLINLIFPPKCVLCGTVLPLGSPCDEPCETCLKKLPILKEPQISIVPGLVCLAPLKYADNVRQGMHGLKFNRRIMSVKYFARLMVQCLKRYGISEFNAVTWVPVSLSRERKRGYDQSELLAREVAKLIGAKPRRLLLKTRNVKPNSSLKSEEERRANVAGAFRLAPFVKTFDKVLLIDDVLTTGSTIAECSNLLIASGTKDITVLTVAYAERS
jgi:ComF family protein